MDQIPTNTQTAVACRDLVAGYSTDSLVFDALDCEVPVAGVTHLRGPNGSGKSTLIEIISGYLAPTAGEVVVLGQTPTQARERRRICRSQPALFPRSTAREHLELACVNTGANMIEVLERASRYGLGQWLDTTTDQLSTGNLRKLWIVACSTGDFGLVAMDEPFNGLDDTGRSVLIDEIGEWARDGAVLLVAHDLPDGLVVDHKIILS